MDHRLLPGGILMGPSPPAVVDNVFIAPTYPGDVGGSCSVVDPGDRRDRERQNPLAAKCFTGPTRRPKSRRMP